MVICVEGRRGGAIPTLIHVQGRVMSLVTVRSLRRSHVAFILLLGGLGALIISAVNTSHYTSRGHTETGHVLLTTNDGRRSATSPPQTTLDLTARDEQPNPRENFAGPNRHLVGLQENVKEAKEQSPHERGNLGSVPASSSSNDLCPLHKPFLVYVYDSPPPGLEHPEVIESLIEHLRFGSSWTDDPESACVFVFVAGPWKAPVSSEELESMIDSLSHWEKHSSRHVLVELSQSTNTSRSLLQVRTGQALLATSYVPSDPTHTHNHVLASPLLARLPSTYHPLPPVMSQLDWGKSLCSLYFEGEMMDPTNNEVKSQITEVCYQVREYVQKPVCSIQCDKGREKGALDHEWSLCGDASTRYKMCKKARFALIPTGNDKEVGPATYTRLLEALQCGAIPVFLGSGQLPFSEVIKWEKAALFLPYQMVPYVKQRLKIMSKEEFKRYQLQGLFLYKTYFSSQLRIVESVVALVRYRHHHPPMWYPDYTPQALVTTVPVSHAHKGKMTFNYTDVWNSPPGPFYTHTRPSQKHSLPSVMFSATADGISTPDSIHVSVTDHPSTERYTIVVLTYHRDRTLLKMLETFEGCPMLAKVVVVWNNEVWSHAEDLSWPNIGVPIEVR